MYKQWGMARKDFTNLSMISKYDNNVGKRRGSRSSIKDNKRNNNNNDGYEFLY
jgi:hypothetical protein